MSGQSVSSWQQAWDQAQPRLQTIRESLLKFPRRSPRVLRVGQLDAELLDAELLQILTDPLIKALGLIHSSYRSRLEPELTLLVRLILYKFSMWDFGATYGAKLQNLRYQKPSATGSAFLAPSGISRWTLSCHAVITILVPYLHSRTRIYALSHSWPDAPSSDIRRRAWDALTRIESAHNAASLASFVVFLCDGRYRTWADRLLGLRLVPSRRSSNREVSYEFMNRQMVWHAFTEFLLFLLPLINIRVLRRRIGRTLGQILSPNIVPSIVRTLYSRNVGASSIGDKAVARHGKYWSLPEDQCAICTEDASPNIIAIPYYGTGSVAATGTASMLTSHTDEPARCPIYTPYIASCGHIYCYVCLAERMLRAEDDGEPAWECLRCEAPVLSADRMEGGVNKVSSQSVEDVQTDALSFESEDFLSSKSE